MQKFAVLPLIAAPFFLTGLGWWASIAKDNSGESFTFSGVVESREIRVGSRVGGRIQEVLVSEGDFVHAGQLLVQLDPYDLTAKRDEAQARVREAQAALLKLREGPRTEEVTQARAAADAARAELDRFQRGSRAEEIQRAEAELQAAIAELENASAAYVRFKSLVESGVVSRQAFEDVKARMERAEALRDAARKTADLLRQGPRSEDIQAAEKRYAEAAARRR